MKHLHVGLVVCLLASASVWGQASRTTITKWQDGKDAALAITYDDSTINQFRIAVPLMNERGLPGTFFVITSQIPGSRHMPTFVGGPIMEILKESETVPTNEQNVYERTSMLRYLAVAAAQRARAGESVATRRNSPRSRGAGEAPRHGTDLHGGREALCAGPVRGGRRTAESRRARRSELGRDPEGRERRTRDRQPAVSHAHMTILDEANIIYEVDKAREELLERMGPKHTFSLEAPYGIRDAHVRDVILVPRSRSRGTGCTDGPEYMDGNMRGNKRDPGTSTKQYVEWQRGPVGSTATFEQMKRLGRHLDRARPRGSCS